MWRGSRWARRDWLTLVRDVVCLVLGMFGVIYEETSGKADLGRLTFFAVLMIAPGALAGLALARSSGTGGQSSLPPPPPEALSPPSAPANGGARE